MLFVILQLSICIEVVSSYIPNIQGSNFMSIIHSFNAPILDPFRKLQSKLFGEITIDFSPVLAIVILNLISDVLL